MEIRFFTDSLKDFKTDALVLLLAEEQTKRKDLPQAATDAINNKDFSGKQDEIVVLYSKDVKAKRIILVGLGKEKELSLEKLRRGSSLSLEKAKSMKITELSIGLMSSPDFSQENTAKAIVDGAALGNYVFDKYITDSERKKPSLDKLSLLSREKVSESARKSVEEERIICEYTNVVRDLVNENAMDKTPEKFASFVKKTVSSSVKCKILDEKDMRKLGMNLILGVNKGSKFPPRLVVLEYDGDPNNKDIIALVGKGITFDSGGLNLKTVGYLETMKQDMAGAGSVLGAVMVASKLKIKKNLVGVMVLTENMPGSGAQKPGDVVKSYSGTTVEIANTDAEGRLVLGDAIAYAVKNYKPGVVIDLATLTGAVVVALGDAAAGVMGNDEKLIKSLVGAGEKTYERVWQLPIYDEHREDVKSEIADIKNLGFSTRTGYAGTIAGAAFIEKFVGDAKWAHLDIAGTAFMERQRYYLRKGATGFGVRLLTEFLKAS